MLFRQVIHEDLGCASYLVGDEHAGIAAVVDPKLDIHEYLRLAGYLGVRIAHILETHTHADHVSGHGRLAQATGATIHVHRDAEAAYPHEPFDDGWELELGRVRVRAIHTPGHRPEHTAFALIDSDRGAEPWALLSGDTLFVGDVARPDLAIDKEEGARGMFHSLHERLLTLPAACEVWPGHLGGSLCGGPGMDLKVASTIAYECAHSPLLQIGDEERFVRETVAELPPQPPNFQRIVTLNRGPLAEPGSEVAALSVAEVDAARRAGALVVDVRAEDAFDRGHIPGAVSISSTHAGFGTKLAWVAAQGDGIVLAGHARRDASAAAELALAVGVDQIVGLLDGGFCGWKAHGLPVASFERVTVRLLHCRLRDDGIQILDVRERAEWEAAHIPGSLNVPYHDIDSLPDGIDPRRPVAVICGSGQRAAVGASLVSLHGAQEVIHVVDGGIPAWRAQGWPLDSRAAALAID